MLFLFQKGQSLVDFENFPIPLLLVKWLLEHGVDHEF